MAVPTSDPTLLAAALDSIPFGVVVITSNGEIVWGNSRLVTLTGYSVEELIGRNITLFHPAAPGSPVPGEAVWRCKNGDLFAATQTVTVLPNGNSLITLQATQPIGQFYRIIAENTVDVIWLWSLVENRCVYISPSVEPLTGFTPEEVLARSMEQLMSPESCRIASSQLTQCVPGVESGDDSCRVRSNELEFWRKDGSTVSTETITKLLSDEFGKARYAIGVTRDITERKLAQKALVEAEEKYRKIFDGAMEGIYRVSVDGRPLAANPAMAKMLGYESPDEALSSVTDVAQDLWVDASERALFVKLMTEDGMVRCFEFRQRRKDGRVIWLSVTNRRVTGPHGEALYNEGFIEDITERKRMEAALRQSEERFSKAFRSSPACIGIFDIADGGRVLDVNEAFERVTGYRREEAIGRKLGELQLFADFSNDPETIHLLSAGRVRDLEHRFRTRNGDIRTGLLSGEQIELDGRQCAITTIIDITERKQAEERIATLATAIEQAGEQIVITGLNGTIQYCNPAFEKTTGYSLEEVSGQNPRVLKSGKQSSEFYRTLWTTINSGSIWSGQFTNRKKDGTLYEEDATISPIRDISGKITGFVAVKRDVSERIQLEHQFRQAQKLESVGRLAGGVAHDFNNLLTVINGYGDLLVERLSPEDPLALYAEEIAKAGARAAGLTRQLLAFSRKQVIEVKALDLNVIVTDAERMLQRVIGEDIELLTTLDPNPGTVMVDPDQIHQVIMNLVINARDAMPDGGKLSIETRKIVQLETAPLSHSDAAPGDYLLLSVTDTGTGMDEKTLESIFEPFFTTKEPGKGTGLGLSTVYGIVRQSGGWVEVTSQLTLGTTFRIYLPRTDACPVAAIDKLTRAHAGPGDKTVLLVEDQEDVRKLTKAILRRHGYEVLEAGNGVDACRIAQQYPGEIHLLLTDVVMPGMNGKELSERLTSMRPTVKVLFSSGYTADVIAHRGVLNPDVAYLAKPFTAVELAAKVREVLSEN